LFDCLTTKRTVTHNKKTKTGKEGEKKIAIGGAVVRGGKGGKTLREKGRWLRGENSCLMAEEKKKRLALTYGADGLGRSVVDNTEESKKRGRILPLRFYREFEYFFVLLKVFGGWVAVKKDIRFVIAKRKKKGGNEGSRGGEEPKVQTRKNV